ncbi:MAG: A24 family peptidase [Lachnospiraceae bacterium]|nr:A24 family peptidase [Lachnospiraceae bacterium]
MVLAVIILTASAAFFDLKNGRIPNRLNLAGIFSGFVLSLIRAGPGGLPDTVTAVAVMFVITFLLFLTHALRGGDGKLLCAVSAILGLTAASRILFTAMLLSIPAGLRIRHETSKSPTTIRFAVPVFFSVLLWIWQVYAGKEVHLLS